MQTTKERCIETIPVGPLGLIALDSHKELGKKVNDYLVSWRQERNHEHKNSLSFQGYERDSYLINAEVPRFGSGEAKGVIRQSVRGADLYLLVDVCNYSMTYNLCGYTNHMSPDDHFQDLKRIIAAVGGKARRINVIMPFLYESRQHKTYRQRISGLCTGTAGAGPHGCRQYHHFRCSRSACTECNPSERF